MPDLAEAAGTKFAPAAVLGFGLENHADALMERVLRAYFVLPRFENPGKPEHKFGLPP
jgi:hypothetical protein